MILKMNVWQIINEKKLTNHILEVKNGYETLHTNQRRCSLTLLQQIISFLWTGAVK